MCETSFRVAGWLGSTGHPERLEGESKDLGTILTAKVDQMRRFFDSALTRSE